MSNRRELYRSPNGDTWFLARDPSNGHAMVVHEANRPSGGKVSFVEVVEFLSNNADAPEGQALLRLMGTLVDVPPYADRT